MKKIILTCFLLSGVFMGVGFYSKVIFKKPSPIDPESAIELQRKALQKIIVNQANKTIEIYKTEGLFGAQQFSLQCYEEFELSPEFLGLIRCLSIDITANTIDEHMSKMMGFKKDDYFHSISIDVRISQAKDYLPNLKHQDTSKLRSFITTTVAKSIK